MQTIQRYWANGAALVALLATITVAAPAAAQAVRLVAPPEEQPAPAPAALTPDLEAKVQKLVEKEVTRRLEEEAKKKADKEKEEARKKEEQQKQKEQQGTEVGQSLDLKGMWANGPQWSSADKSFRFHVGGR